MLSMQPSMTSWVERSHCDRDRYRAHCVLSVIVGAIDAESRVRGS